ncbi:IclR family transcriptional regulator [Gemmobacter sp.]|uniref:IclR family transcriptional regulator n=1 Tax=Gemmobacter sp. TaxID=1898957 RepID=UPI002AFFAAD5|nr:helix-turn-helix domain-containing protein [Gemmobacter sp.]
MKLKSAERVMQLLLLFKDLRRPATLQELAALLDTPKSSTMYLLKTLQQMGFLNFNASRQDYFPTARLRSLSAWMDDSPGIDAPVAAIMRRLHERFGETVAVGVRNDLFLQYLGAIESSAVVRYSISAGDQRPLVESAMGWTLLGTLSDTAAEQVIRRAAIQLGTAPFVPETTADQLARIRVQKGYVREDLVKPYRATTIAMLLPGSFNGQLRVLGVGGPTDRILPVALDIAREIRTLISTMEKT